MVKHNQLIKMNFKHSMQIFVIIIAIVKKWNGSSSYIDAVIHSTSINIIMGTVYFSSPHCCNNRWMWKSVGSTRTQGKAFSESSAKMVTRTWEINLKSDGEMAIVGRLMLAAMNAIICCVIGEVGRMAAQAEPSDSTSHTGIGKIFKFSSLIRWLI